MRASFSLASWNMEQLLSRQDEIKKGARGHIEHVRKHLLSIGAQTIALQEFYLGSVEEAEQAAARLLGKEYPHRVFASYEDSNLSEQPVIALISRLALHNVNIVSLGSGDHVRNGIIADVAVAPNVRARVAAVHFTDKDEQGRIGQAASTTELKELATDEGLAFAAVGDMNAMHGESKRSWLLRQPGTLAVAKRIPNPELSSIATRLSGMAGGSTMAVLQAAGLWDADPLHQPTMTPKMQGMPAWMPSVRLVQIDHIMISDGISVRESPSGREYRIYDDGGADHRAIKANLEIE